MAVFDLGNKLHNWLILAFFASGKIADRLQQLHIIKDNLRDPQKRNGQDHSRDPPDQTMPSSARIDLTWQNGYSPYIV
jgi:hypothetical protein